MNYKEPLTQSERKEHEANLEQLVPAVYCGTYHKYNCGSLSGMWINLSSFDNHNDFIEFCKRLHCNEEDPELMFQDFEGFPRCWYSESGMSRETFDKIHAYAELDDERKDAYEAYINFVGEDYATLEKFEEHYEGKWDSCEDFAEYLYTELYGYEIPEFLQGFIDWSAVWRNLDTAGDYTEEDGFIFRRD